MEMLRLLNERKSVRRFKRRPVSPEVIAALKEAALLSPSSRGINPWRFLFITDKDILTGLAGAKEHGSSFLRGAPLGIVVCANSRESDVWIEDCSIAAMIIQLTAQTLGLGSCWIQIRKRVSGEGVSSQKYVSRLLGLGKELKVLAIIAAGYPSDSNKRKKAIKPEQKKILV